MSTANTANLIKNWTVIDLTDSDHRVISFDPALPAKRAITDTRYDVKSADWNLFRTTLLGEVGRIPVSCTKITAECITRAITTAADKSIPKIRRADAAGRNPWWSPALSTLCQNLARQRRCGLKISDRQFYNKLRNEFLKEIRNSKRDTWKCFAGDLNVNPRGKAFSWAKHGNIINSMPSSLSSANGPPITNCRETADLILSTFVPSDPQEESIVAQGPIRLIGELSPDEIKTAIWKMKPKGAPGIDGITAGILRKAWLPLKETITDLFLKCLQQGTFPECWKTARLVLIPKPGKDNLGDVKSYRPISLLPVLGKALESLIIDNLTRETNLDSHSEQHGFTAGRSTITAIEAMYDWVDASSVRHIFGVFLDITVAFDNVQWSPLLEQLLKLGASVGTLRIIGSYLNQRSAEFTLEGTRHTKMLERGCPQGSKLGPTLWKVAMTPIFDCISRWRSIKVIAYANDILLMVGAARPHTAFRRIEHELDSLTN